MRIFKIKTDKEYFERFGELAERIRNLGSLFQNSDAISNEHELIEWEEIGDKIDSDFSELRYEAQFRLEETNK